MWLKREKKYKDKIKFESIKDHNWEEILTQLWNIEIYTIKTNENQFWKNKINKNQIKKIWKIKT